MRNYFPKRPSGASLHTLSELYDVPVGFVNPPPLILRLNIAYFAVAEGWLLLDIGWFVLFLLNKKCIALKPKLLSILYFMNEKFNKNAKLTKMCSSCEEEKGLIVKDPFLLYVLCKVNVNIYFQCLGQSRPCSAANLIDVIIDGLSVVERSDNNSQNGKYQGNHCFSATKCRVETNRS